MSNYLVRTSILKTPKELVSTVNNYKLINTNDTLENYSHVVFNSNIEDIDGEFIVFNAPSSAPARKFYLEVIRMAEMHNIEKNNKIGNGYVTISDIASVISKINSSPMRISHGRIFLQITGSKISDILPNKIECWYKFPTDNAYMVICKSRPNYIEIMPGDMKTNKEDEDENVNNQTTD